MQRCCGNVVTCGGVVDVDQKVVRVVAAVLYVTMREAFEKMHAR